MNENIKKSIKELLDQATILLNKKTNEDIAEHLANSKVVCFPVNIGDVVYFLSVRSPFGSLLTNGVVVQRKVDMVAYDGKIKIFSFRPNENDAVGNLYEYWGEMVFQTKENALTALEALKNK